MLSGDQIDADHLDHGYALTVHRTQGATADRTHYLAEGGGRELAYVALSRARQHTTIHTVANDLDQALDDLTYQWDQPAAQDWISLTHQPDLSHTLDQIMADLAQVDLDLDGLDRQAPSPAPTYEPPTPRLPERDFGMGR